MLFVRSERTAFRYGACEITHAFPPQKAKESGQNARNSEIIPARRFWCAREAFAAYDESEGLSLRFYTRRRKGNMCFFCALLCGACIGSCVCSRSCACSQSCGSGYAALSSCGNSCSNSCGNSYGNSCGNSYSNSCGDSCRNSSCNSCGNSCGNSCANTRCGNSCCRCCCGYGRHGGCGVCGNMTYYNAQYALCGC